MATTRFVFTPEAAHFPSTNFPALTQQGTTLRPILAYDAATNETAYWTFIAWQGLTGALTAVVHYTMASATASTVEWEVSLEAFTDGESTTADSFATSNSSGTVTVPGTAGLLDQISITLTNNDSIAAGDYCRIRLVRDAATDGASGDAHVFALELREA